MYEVTLESFIQFPTEGRAVAASRTVSLPVAPYPGLVVVLGEIVHFEISRVEFYLGDNTWSAECPDEILGGEYSSLPDEVKIMQEAGFETRVVDLSDPDPGKLRRHLRPVR